jgi:lysophospholipase L1-like esterase
VDSPPIGVLNLGIGGNRVLEDGLGPNLLSRLDRDIIAQSGVQAVILLEGINDIGTAALESDDAIDELVHRITAAYRQVVIRCRAKGLRIYGGTLTPMGGSSYFTEGRETARQRVNEWIRSSGFFDGVIDFDRTVRDPEDPERLLPGFDSGDHLHLNDTGYEAMARSIDLYPLRRTFPLPDRNPLTGGIPPRSPAGESGVPE